jgi:hypothetical protein
MRHVETAGRPYVTCLLDASSCSPRTTGHLGAICQPNVTTLVRGGSSETILHRATLICVATVATVIMPTSLLHPYLLAWATRTCGRGASIPWTTAMADPIDVALTTIPWTTVTTAGSEALKVSIPTTKPATQALIR